MMECPYSFGVNTVQLSDKTVWTVSDRYHNLTPVSTVSHGLICMAEDTMTGENVAIKNLSKSVFQTAADTEQTYHELMLLKHMDHENIIYLRDVFTPNSNASELTDIYLVGPLMDADLSKVLKAQKLSNDQVQFLVYQLLRGLKYIHSMGLIHGDLEPGIIGVNQDCELRILGMGYSLQPAGPTSRCMTTMNHCWIPELDFPWLPYTQAVDIWTVGCIMAELVSGKQLLPGTGHVDPFSPILDLIIARKPGTEFLPKVEPNELDEMFGDLKLTDHLFDQFSDASSDAIDLLAKMMEFNPEKRLDASQALAHPYFSKYHDPDDEPSAKPLTIHWDADLSIEQWKEKIWKEIRDFQSQANSEPNHKQGVGE